MFRFARPELIIYVLPVLAGVLAGKYVGRLVNFCIMLAVFQVGLFILVSANSGELRPRFLVPVIFIWAADMRGAVCSAAPVCCRRDNRLPSALRRAVRLEGNDEVLRPSGL